MSAGAYLSASSYTDSRAHIDIATIARPAQDPSPIVDGQALSAESAVSLTLGI